MYRLYCKISIGNKSFDYVHAATWSSSWKQFTQTAEIKIPNRFLKNGETIVAGENNVFKRGDVATLEFGYFPNLTTRFSGYISNISPGSLLTIKFQDRAYLLKQKRITKSWPSVSLATLLSECFPDENISAISAELGSIRFTDLNGVEVLEFLKKEFGITSFYRGETLIAGVPYSGAPPVHDFDFERNIISHNLEYKRADDVLISVKAISIQADNTRIETTVGDANGDGRTLLFYNLSETELKAAAEREIDKLKYSGYYGTFTTFGTPVVAVGDIVRLKDRKNPERNGEYFVEAVDGEFGLNGYRQTIKPGAVANV